MKKKVLILLARVAMSAAKRAEKKASEFGLYQPQRPNRIKKSI